MSPQGAFCETAARLALGAPLAGRSRAGIIECGGVGTLTSGAHSFLELTLTSGTLTLTSGHRHGNVLRGIGRVRAPNGAFGFAGRPVPGEPSSVRYGDGPHVACPVRVVRSLGALVWVLRAVRLFVTGVPSCESCRWSRPPYCQVAERLNAVMRANRKGPDARDLGPVVSEFVAEMTALCSVPR